MIRSFAHIENKFSDKESNNYRKVTERSVYTLKFDYFSSNKCERFEIISISISNRMQSFCEEHCSRILDKKYKTVRFLARF